MKRALKALALTLLISTLAAGAVQADKPVMGVAEFSNTATGVFWWTGGVGWDLASMLANELVNTGSFSVVERSNLEPVLREQDLVSAGRVSQASGAKVGQMTGAQYLVYGTVTAFEGNVQGTGGGIGYKGIRLGGKKKKAYIAVDLRVVNTTSGVVEFVRTVEGRAGGKGLSVGVARSGFYGDLDTYKDTPAGKAIRAVVVEATDYLECAMVKQDNCMAEYDAKEKKRRDGLKDTVKLD